MTATAVAHRRPRRIGATRHVRSAHVRHDVPTATYLTALHIGRYLHRTAWSARFRRVPVAIVHPPALRRGGDGDFAPSRA